MQGYAHAYSREHRSEQIAEAYTVEAANEDFNFTDV